MLSLIPFLLCSLATATSTTQPFLTYLFSGDTKQQASIDFDEKTKNYIIKRGSYNKTSLAYATYDASYLSTGWDTLAISSYQGDDGKYEDDQKAYAMGYLEGALTSNQIWNHYQNTKFRKYRTEAGGEMPKDIQQFLTDNFNWAMNMGTTNATDPFWYHAKLILLQLQGLVDGYNSVTPKEQHMSVVDMQIVNSDAELSDISYIDPKRRPPLATMTSQEILKYVLSRSRCSSIIKVAADFSDIWFGHNTWTSFSAMIRIFKEYRFKSNNKTERSLTVAFSSYPGSLSSIDDFYITDKDLYIAETTNEVFNNDLWNVLTPQSLLTWHRVILANRLADNSKDWSDIFSRQNSGTYNNQFMVLDLKLIDTHNQVVSDNALWIVEQIPSLVKGRDRTEILRRGYWPSYNSAYFKDIRQMSFYQEEINAHPDTRDDLDYSTCARANIFRREEGNVNSLESFKSLLRFNKFQTDPLSKGKPSHTIACRDDLAVEPSCFGAIDAKAASIKDIKGLGKKKIHIIAGPTTDSQVPFRTNSACNKNGHQTFKGLPNEFNFSWVVYETTLFEN
jgi:hypothetical protein